MPSCAQEASAHLQSNAAWSCHQSLIRSHSDVSLTSAIQTRGLLALLKSRIPVLFPYTLATLSMHAEAMTTLETTARKAWVHASNGGRGVSQLSASAILILYTSPASLAIRALSLFTQFTRCMSKMYSASREQPLGGST